MRNGEKTNETRVVNTLVGRGRLGSRERTNPPSADKSRGQEDSSHQIFAKSESSSVHSRGMGIGKAGLEGEVSLYRFLGDLVWTLPRGYPGRQQAPPTLQRSAGSNRRLR